MKNYYLVLGLLVSCAPLENIKCTHTCIADSVTSTASICGEDEIALQCIGPQLGEAVLAQEVIVRSGHPLVDETTVVQIYDDHHFWISGKLRDFDLGGGVYSKDEELLGIIEEGDTRWRFAVRP
jgi:hypothetical protein